MPIGYIQNLTASSQGVCISECSMQPQHLRHLAIAALIFLFTSLAFISCIPPSYDNPSYSTTVSRFTFFENFDSWIEDGYRQYGELWLNKSLTTEIVVGKGENFEDIQEALDAGYSCIYLKKQRFNITEPIRPPKEDFYIIGNGAEIFAMKQISAVFNIRNVRYAHLDGLFINGNGLAEKL